MSKKILSTAVAIGIIATTTLTSAVYADPATNALPVPDANYASLNENVTFNKPSSNNMVITVDNGTQGAVGKAYWNSFNIGSNATVEVDFTAHHQTLLNKVTGNNMSEIYGSFINRSACSTGACNHQDTGKVILLNPNGIVFGSGANVNLNSFTASTFGGKYEKNGEVGEGTLQLTRNKNTSSNGGIKVLAGANIKADKNIAFASDNISIYNGSKLSTNTTLNDVTNNGESFGKVKLVTSDGVNFEYYNNGAITKVDNTAIASEKMLLSVNGEITSGNIDLRNHSTHSESDLNLNGAVLKAYKAEKGNDGNIWLTSNNKVTVANSKFTTAYDSNGNQTNIAARVSEKNSKDKLGNVVITAGNIADINGNSSIDAVGDVKITTANTGDNNYLVLDNSTIQAKGNVLMDSQSTARVQNNSSVKAKNITMKGKTGVYVPNDSSLTTKNYGDGDIVILSADGRVWTDKATVTSGNDISIEATNDYVTLDNSAFKADGNISIKSKKKVDSAKIASSTYNAGKDINVTSTGEDIVLAGLEPFQSYKNLNLNAANNIQIYKNDADLTVSNVNLDAGNNIYLQTSTVDIDTDNDTINVPPTNYDVTIKNTNFNKAKGIGIVSGKNVKTEGSVDTKGIKTYILADQDIDVTLQNVANRDNGLVALTGKNLTVTTPGTLSVSALYSQNGDLTINADKVIAGKDYVNDSAKIPSDLAGNRSYISVQNGTFTSNTTNDAFYVTESDTPLNDGTDRYMRHHIQYGEGTEKLVLMNPRPYKYPPVPSDTPVVGPVVGPVVEPAVANNDLDANDDEARKVNKIPRAPEAYNDAVSISDDRTVFMDVFAAASQIEIDDLD